LAGSTVRVRDTAAMIAQMAPQLRPGRWTFVCVDPAGAEAAALRDRALAAISEPEGLSLILAEAEARAAGLPVDLPMAHILLRVTSALDGVGLTAAVAGVLADADIPCNVVAGHRHDHLFVPVAQAHRALDLLATRATR